MQTNSITLPRGQPVARHKVSHSRDPTIPYPSHFPTRERKYDTRFYISSMAPISNPLYLHLHDATISDSTNMLRTRTPVPPQENRQLGAAGDGICRKRKVRLQYGPCMELPVTGRVGSRVLPAYLPDGERYGALRVVWMRVR